MKKLIAFGEILFDIFPDRTEIGGAPLNFSSHFAALGGEAYIASALGDDALGEKALSILKSRGISDTLVSRCKLPTGRCDVTLDERGIPSYSLASDVAYDDIRASVSKIKEICADAFVFGTLIQRSEKNRKLLEEILSSVSFGEVLCDINIRKGMYSAESILFCLSHATILKFSNDSLEEAALADAVGASRYELIERLFTRFSSIKLILYTLGDEGSVIYERASRCAHRIPAIETPTPISTVGAGDSYGAAFLFSHLSGKSVYECGMAASRLSSYVVGLCGAI